MATRSVIGVMYGDVCKSVYCHWDGYLEGVGAMLLENYGRVGASELIALGDISSLQAEIGVAHPFSIFEQGEDGTPKISQAEYDALYGDMTTFYGRDRLEPDSVFKTSQTYADLVERAERCGAEYMYVMGMDNQWYVADMYNDVDEPPLRLLRQALEDERAAALVEKEEA